MSSATSSLHESKSKPDDMADVEGQGGAQADGQTDLQMDEHTDYQMDHPPTASETTVSGPPSLEYTLRTRVRSIIFFWSMILVDSVLAPIALYFGLWYDTNLSPNTVFSIVTAAIGGASILEYFVRFWRLWKKGSTCRTIGGRRAYVCRSIPCTPSAHLHHH